MPKTLKILSLLLIALMLLVTLALGLLARDQALVTRLAQTVAASNGYDLEIPGAARIRFLPQPGIELESLRLFPAGQADLDPPGAPILSAEGFWLGISPIALLQGLIQPAEGRLRGSVPVEADVLRAGGLTFSGFVSLTRLDADQIQTELSASGFYGGNLSARYQRQPGLGSQPEGAGEMEHRLEAQVRSVQLMPLLEAVYGNALLSGRGDLDLDLQTRGRIGFRDVDRGPVAESMPEPWRAQLGGQVDLRVRDARIQGLDLAPLVQALGGNQEDLDAATSLSGLDASALGQDGRFELISLKGLSPLLEFSGGGHVDVVSERLALDLEALTLERPDRKNWNQAAGIRIPIQARGDWAKPEWRVDLEPVLKQGAARALERHGERLKELEQQIGVPGLERGLRDLLGL